MLLKKFTLLLSCGGWFSFIYKLNGEVFCFGINEFGQLGLGNNDTHNKPVFLMKDATINQICCGLDHSMIFKQNGEIWVFGFNAFGQLVCFSITSH